MSLFLLLLVLAAYTYRPTRWCANRACHQPIPADARRCPHCRHEQPLRTPEAVAREIEALATVTPSRRTP